jgi:hypothetical protein
MDCAFPSVNGWSKTIFDYHIFSTCLALPVAYLLITDTKLERFYYPLAMAAKSSIVLQLLESFSYLAYLPADFEHLDAIHNCTDVVLSRIHAMITIFGEMHLVYFLSKALGLGGQSISFGRGLSLNLPQALILALSASFGTCMACIFYRRTFGLVRNLWTVSLALLQYQQIRSAKSKLDNEDCLIRPDDASVSMFEKLTAIQIFTSLTCLLQRGVYKQLFPHNIVQLNNSRLVVDYFSVFVFYLKVLLVKEKANVEVIVEGRDV